MATEQRLIDANALKGNFMFLRKMWSETEISATIDEAPTIEARPVVHGRWEECDLVKFDGHSECIHHPRAAWCCSNCRNAFKKELLWKDNYCPNCGALMDGGAENGMG